MRDSFLQFAQPGVYPNILRMSCEIVMFRGTGHSSTGKNRVSSRLSIGRGTSGNTTIKTPEGAHGEPLIATKSSNVVSSGIAFTALDLITRPSLASCHNVFFCVEAFAQPRAQVPPLRHDTSWNLRSNSEHHHCAEWQQHPSMMTSLQSLTRRSAITRHMALVRNVRCMLNNPRNHWRVN